MYNSQKINHSWIDKLKMYLPAPCLCSSISHTSENISADDSIYFQRNKINLLNVQPFHLIVIKEQCRYRGPDTIGGPSLHKNHENKHRVFHSLSLNPTSARSSHLYRCKLATNSNRQIIE